MASAELSRRVEKVVAYPPCVIGVDENSAQGNITFKGNTGVVGVRDNVAGGICKSQDNPLFFGVFNLDVNGLLNSCNTQ